MTTNLGIDRSRFRRRVFDATRLIAPTIILLIAAGCARLAVPMPPPEAFATPTTTPSAPAPAAIPAATAEARSASTDRWAELLGWTAYPYAAPLPAPTATRLDGTYVKVDPRPRERAGCRRCPPYPPVGGVWKLHLDRGTFRIYHAGTGWRSLGSFTIAGDRISFFNDPQCTDAVGAYAWTLSSGQLTLQRIEDACGPDLRAWNLAGQPWLSCQPPSTEAAITDHWPKPAGCESSD